MKINFNVSLSIAFVFVFFAGCATSRSEIQLTTPDRMPVASQAGLNNFAFIRSVKDHRIFHDAPKDPSIPSLGFEGASDASADLKARAIGRKRNGFGQALGDVVLPIGQTVESVVRANLAAALEQSGYQLKNDAQPGTGVLVIDVAIKQFWAWLQPKFATVTVNAIIATDLTLSESGSATTIKIDTQDSRQLVTDGAWKEILDKALQLYRAEVAAKAVGFR